MVKEGVPKLAEQKPAPAEMEPDYLAEAKKLTPDLRQLEKNREQYLAIIEKDAGINLRSPLWDRMWQHRAPIGIHKSNREAQKAAKIARPQGFGEAVDVWLANVVTRGRNKIGQEELAAMKKYGSWLRTRIGSRGSGPEGKFSGIEKRLADVLKHIYGIGDEKQTGTPLAQAAVALLRGTKLVQPRLGEHFIDVTIKRHTPNSWIVKKGLSTYFILHANASPEDICVAIATAIETKITKEQLELKDDDAVADRKQLIADIERLKRRAEKSDAVKTPAPIKQEVRPAPAKLVETPKPQPVEVRPAPKPEVKKTLEPLKPKPPARKQEQRQPQPRQEQQKPKDQGQGERAQKKRNRNRNKKKGAGPKN